MRKQSILISILWFAVYPLYSYDFLGLPKPAYDLYEIGGGASQHPSANIFLLGYKNGTKLNDQLGLWQEYGIQYNYEHENDSKQRHTINIDYGGVWGSAAFLALKVHAVLPLTLTNQGKFSTGIGGRISYVLFGISMYYEISATNGEGSSLQEKAGIMLSIPICRETYCLGRLG